MSTSFTKKNTLPGTEYKVNGLEGLEQILKIWFRDVVDEVITEKMCNVNQEDKRLTAKELCERWNIGKTTLYNKEKAGIIKPLSVSGRKKIYSEKDVIYAEIHGKIKNVCNV